MTSVRTSSRTPERVRQRDGGSAVSVVLRTRTRAAHLATERAFDLDARLAGLGAYGELLVRLRGVHAPLEAALAVVPGWSAAFPTLDLERRRRVPLLDVDLTALGVDPSGPTAPVVAPDNPAAALGCLYVLEGSALGGQVVARRARVALGARLPVAFFAGDGGRSLGRDWRAVLGALDAVHRTLGAAAVDEVVAGAERTFAVVGSWLGSSTSAAEVPG